MCTTSTASFAGVEISCIGLAVKYHVAGLISDSIIGVCGYIVNKLFYCFVGGFSGGVFLLSEFSECK